MVSDSDATKIMAQPTVENSCSGEPLIKSWQALESHIRALAESQCLVPSPPPMLV